MSRTKRNCSFSPCRFRNPKNQSLRKANEALDFEIVDEYDISKLNRINGRYLVSSWDDIICSAALDKWTNM